MAEPKQEPAKLEQMLGYQPDLYLQEDELSIIRNTFKDNPKLLAIIRKIFIPTVLDPELPIENLADDVFNAGRTWSQIPAEEAKILMVARQEVIQFVLGGLVKLKVIANQSVKSPIQNPKDSVK